MDQEAENLKKKEAERYIQTWLEHPITARVLEDNRTQQEAFVDLICGNTVDSIGGFFAHFEAVGHLRGLRRINAVIHEKLEEITEELTKEHQ